MRWTAALVVAGLVLVGGCATPTTSRSMPQGRATSSSVPAPPVSHRALADRAAARLLAQVSVPGTLHRESSGTAFGLGTPLTAPDSDHLLDRSRVWAGATGSAGDLGRVQAYVARHLPAGARESGSTSTADGSVPGSSHVASISGVMYFLDRRWQDPSAYAGLGLQVAYTVRDGRVAVRADAQVIYLPTRTAAQHVPATVTGADLAVISSAAGASPPPAARRRVGATVARRLAADLNVLRPATPGATSCPAITHSTSTTLRFTGFATPVGYTDDACGGGVTIGRGPVLVADARFAADVRAASR